MPDGDQGILIVEDFAGLGAMMVRWLLEAGYQRSEHVPHARAAAEWMAQHPVALILLDVELGPRGGYRDGIEAATVFARKWPGLRVGLVSGYGPDDLNLPAGISLMQKPLYRQEFLAWVAGLLRLPPWVPPMEER